jgi:hypothetical protein
VLTSSTLPLVVDRRIDRKGTVRRTALESMAALYDSLAARFVTFLHSQPLLNRPFAGRFELEETPNAWDYVEYEPFAGLPSAICRTFHAEDLDTRFGFAQGILLLRCAQPSK